jgi:hypothetical protein
VVHRSLDRFLLLLLGCLGLLSPGCSRPPSGDATTPVAPLPPPKPRNADELARTVAGGGVEALGFVERLRGHPLAKRIGSLDQLRELLEGTGIDPERDLERTFMVAPTIASEESSVAVAEHSLPRERVEQALGVLVARSKPPGQWRTDLGVPAARVTVKGRSRVVALVEPNLLVILPESRAREALRFVGTGGLPLPVGPEAVVAKAVEPARTMRGVLPVHIPETLSSAQVLLTPTPDGGADLHIDAQSSSAAQASADAAALSREVARATTVEIAVIRIRVFDPIEFRSEQDWVRADRHLTAQEVERIFALASALLPQ